MKLHANAALSLSKRRVLCQRVLEQDWTLTKAAEAAEVSVRCARKWVGRYRAPPTAEASQVVTIDTSSPGGTTGTHGFFFCANQ